MIQMQQNCDILCVTEHWKSQDQLAKLGIGNFDLVAAFCREEGKHGGAAIYSKKGLKCKSDAKLNNLSICGVFECVVAECTVAKGNVITVACIYRPPTGDFNVFLVQLEQLLVNSFSEKKNICIVGDFNVETLIENEKSRTLLSLMNSFNLAHTITENTRITSNSSSCIDNIFTNMQYISAVVFDNFISDHMGQKISFEVDCKVKEYNSYKRIFSDENKRNFLSRLREQDWEGVYQARTNGVNEQWNEFMNIYKSLFNEGFPLKLGTKKRKATLYKDENIIACKNRLDILLTLSKRDNRYKEMYANHKKVYDKLLVSARAEQYEHRIRQSDNKSKCMWSICKEINGLGTNRNIEVLGSPEQIATNYNNFLLSTVPDLVNKITKIPFSSKINDNISSIFLYPVTPNEICEITEKIKNKHSSGIDEIPTSIVKSSTTELKNVLCYIINNSFKFGIFPDNLKVALIKPCFKKGDPEKLDNYRPISLLPGFSKIFEYAMSTRIINFFKHNNLFSRCQHGFLKGKSTQTAIFAFIKNILEHLEKGDLTLAMLLDLTKAYDCLDRELLILKAEKYGIRGKALKWLKSYVNNRMQSVTVTKNGKTEHSKILANDVGIAQGSILGPILFIIFINDLYLLLESPNQHIVKYADDTNLIISCKTIEDLITKAKEFFDKVTDWFCTNKLIVNKEKTNFVLFKTKQSNIAVPEHIAFDNEKFELTQQAKFLGIYINEHLDWSYQITQLCKKLNSVCYGIRVLSKYLNETSVKILYYANFESVLKYGIIFWGRDSMVENVFVVQKRVLRIVKKMNYRQSCRSVFKDMGIMTVYAIYIYESLVFFFQNKNLFECKSEHGYNTRTMDFKYLVHRLTITEKSPLYMCVNLWNALPNQIKSINSIKKFKAEIKNLLITTEPYRLRDFCPEL